MTKQVFKALGLMSGTSLDGVDLCLIETDGMNYVEVLGHFYRKYPDELRARLAKVAVGDIPLSDLLRLEHELSEEYAQACLESGLLREADVVGCHGQTIRHLPQEGLTWQLGDPNWLAERIGKPVVMDFRRRDMAAGGEGAPLVPLFHAVMLAERKLPAALLNIGGVANISVVRSEDDVLASDCGPGMGLLDQWIKDQTGAEFDRDGALSLAGVADEEVIAAAFSGIAFFKRGLPRSADRYEFNSVLKALAGKNVADGAATLCALTVAGVDVCLKEMGFKPGELDIYLVGGGGLNLAIGSYFSQKGWRALPGSDLGWEPMTVEAACFAWLAVRRVLGLDTTLPTTTGCIGPTCGGVLTV